MRNVWIALGVVGMSLPALGWKPAPQDEAAKPEYYTAKVKPIIENNCYKCHGGENHRGGLSMVTRDAMLKGGHHGAAVVPGDPSKSLLITLARHEGPVDDPMPMPPPPRTKLSDDDIATLEHWVKAGAVMPADEPKP
jgi:cytochrome c